MIQYLLFSLLFISKAKAKQFQRQPKKIQKTNENLQEEDKKYTRKQNVDLYTDWVVNKIIEKDADTFFK